MNIAVFADVHGRILLCFKLCARWERETGQKIDYILQAGDLAAFPDEKRLDKATAKHAQSDPSELGFMTDFVRYNKKVAEALDQTTCPLLFVRGNHEDHLWLDGLEEKTDDADSWFSIDPYQRIWCLKTGIPAILNGSDGEALSVCGVGRIGAPDGETETELPKYIQLAEKKRIKQIRSKRVDILLTHDCAKNDVKLGSGSEEIRWLLNKKKPIYHFFGHYGSLERQQMDRNGITRSSKLAELHWGKEARAKTLPSGSMAILSWHGREEHRLELVTESWLNEYGPKTWRAL